MNKTKFSLDFDEEPMRHVSFERLSIYSRPTHGPLRQAIPCMNISTAVFCCMLNLVLPGIGTMISALTVWDSQTCYESGNSATKVFFMNLCTGFLQLLLTPIIIGYLWSIFWAILFIQLSRKWYISNLSERTQFLDVFPCSRV